MSKVKIQGNASGTGVLTVTAPNTNTDRTITLPDGDVTLGAATPSIDDNGDATAITIDSSEKVNFNQGRLQLGHINKFIDTANYVGDAINIGSHPFANGTVIGQSYPADSPTTIKRTIHTTGTETKFFTVSGATETERVRIDQHGIKFNGDTSADNALDDYETGTWTPVMNGVSGGSTQAVYVKVGRMVTCHMMNWGFTATAVSATVSGLPFTSNGAYITGAVSACDWVTNAASVWGYSQSNLYVRDCVNMNEGTGRAGSPRYFSMSITYRTT